MSEKAGYPGSKAGAGVWQRIISQMPRHTHYFEPFVGHGIVLRNKLRAPGANVGIDEDGSVVDWWRSRPTPSWMTILQGDAIRILDVPVFGLNMPDVPRIPSLLSAMVDRAALYYFDPPYLLSTRTRLIYDKEFHTVEEHIRLLRLIKSLPGYVMLSGYPSKLYSNHLTPKADWRVITYKTMTRGGLRDECLWMNFPDNLPLHDCRFVGTGFRERERIKRKKQRWVSRLMTMPPAERQVIAEALAEVDRPSPERAMVDAARPSVVMASVRDGSDY